MANTRRSESRTACSAGTEQVGTVRPWSGHQQSHVNHILLVQSHIYKFHYNNKQSDLHSLNVTFLTPTLEVRKISDKLGSTRCHKSQRNVYNG